MDIAGLIRGKTAAIAGAGILGAGILGGVAFAAAPAPVATDVAAAPAPQAAGADQDKDKGPAKLKAVLDSLVDKGVITRAQADAILDAFAKAHRDDGADLRHFVGDVFKASVAYLGLPADQVKQQLAAGKSLGEIANATPGKSRDGLVAALDDAAAARIKAAVDAGKIKPEQAEQLRTKVDAAIVKLVDHEGHPRPAVSPKPAATP